jgi:hypothetical protein
MATDDQIALSTILLNHRFQESDTLGLYASQPTVCSCGRSPSSPGYDWDWWVMHVTNRYFGLPPLDEWMQVDGEWTKEP